jgi:peptide/nickel transport system permease protein
MITYALRRLLWSAASLWLMSLLVFAGVHAIGDPVALLISPQADQAEIARATALLGLDQPLWRQYLLFFQGALSGNLGHSFVASVPAIDLILERLPATLELALAAMLIAAGLGIPLGLYAGWRPRSIAARAVMALSTIGFALPTFWVGLMLILVFAVQLGVLPSTGRGATVEIAGIGWSVFTAEGLRHLLLPALTLALFKLGLLIRLTRAGTREALAQDYIRFARAKGLAEPAVLRRHVLPNIMIPVLTVAALEFGSLIAFAIVTETVFAWPGMGKLLIDSIGLLDRPVIVAYLMVTIALFIAINLIADLLHALLDPRVRLEGAT